MKKLLVLALVAFAAWQAWKHYPDLFRHRPAHEVVVRNGSGHKIERLRVMVGGQTFVKEELDGDAETMFRFNVSGDSPFRLEWRWADRNEEKTWSGGMVPSGPMVQRHVITIQDDGGVIYTAGNLTGS